MTLFSKTTLIFAIQPSEVANNSFIKAPRGVFFCASTANLTRSFKRQTRRRCALTRFPGELFMTFRSIAIVFGAAVTALFSSVSVSAQGRADNLRPAALSSAAHSAAFANRSAGEIDQARYEDQRPGCDDAC